MTTVARLLILAAFIGFLWANGGKIVRMMQNAPARSIPMPADGALDAAARDADTAQLDLYINQKKLSPDILVYGEPILFIAVKGNNAEGINLLAKAGANMNVTNAAGKTPVAVAKEARFDPIAKLLISLGSKDDGAAIDWSAEYRNKSRQELADLFAQATSRNDPRKAMDVYAAGLFPDIRDSKGVTPLGNAMGLGNEPLVSYVLDQGASPNETDASGRPYFFSAVLTAAAPAQYRRGAPTLLDAFLQHGVDVNVTDKRDATALNILKENPNVPGRQEVEQKLISRGAHENIVNTSR